MSISIVDNLEISLQPVNHNSKIPLNIVLSVAYDKRWGIQQFLNMCTPLQIKSPQDPFSRILRVDCVGKLRAAYRTCLISSFTFCATLGGRGA